MVAIALTVIYIAIVHSECYDDVYVYEMLTYELVC